MASAGRSSTLTCRRSAASCGERRTITTGSRRSCSASSRARSSGAKAGNKKRLSPRTRRAPGKRRGIRDRRRPRCRGVGEFRMFISKKHLSRRTVLRGMGVSVALPLLDAMVPAGTALAQTAAAPKPKMGFFYLPHGAVMDRWRPAAAGRAFDLPQILAPYEPFLDRMTIVSGLRNKAAEGAGVHTVNPGTWLSCSSPLWPKTGDAERGVSADQLAARVIGADTLFPSLEVCTEVKASSGQACNPEFGCGFGSTISFRGATQPLPMEHNPRKLFYRLFGQGDTAAERAAIIAQTGSLLDLVRESSSSLRG